jgi:hypothetical protein
MAKNNFIFSIGLSATLLCSGALFVSAAETSSADVIDAGNAPTGNAVYDTLENLSGGVDTAVNAAGNVSGAGLSSVTKFFGAIGAFFQKISARIGDVFANLPQTSVAAWQWLVNFLATYGWLFAGVIGLLIAGFIVFKLLQLPFLRHFLVWAVLGAVFIIAVTVLIIWGAKKLPSPDELDTALSQSTPAIEEMPAAAVQYMPNISSSTAGLRADIARAWNEFKNIFTAPSTTTADVDPKQMNEQPADTEFFENASETADVPFAADLKLDSLYIEINP